MGNEISSCSKISKVVFGGENLVGDYTLLKDVTVGKGSKIWHFCNIYGCSIGEDTQIGSYCQIKNGVFIGSYCRIQDGVSIPEKTYIGNYVFIGPRAAFANDLFPNVKKIQQHSYLVEPVKVGDYASIGLGAMISAGVFIGEHSLIGAGSVVIKNVADFAVVVGNPARVIGDVRDEKYKRHQLL